MSESNEETSLVEGEDSATRDDAVPAQPVSDDTGTAHVEDEEVRGWPDEPTTS